MTGFETAVAAVAVGWLVTKFKKTVGRAADIADDSMESLLNRLHSLVLRKLGEDPALEKLESEAQSDEVSDRTSKRVELALQEAVEENPEFGDSLKDLVAQLQQSGETDGMELSAGRDFIQHSGKGNMIFHSGSGNLNMNRYQRDE